MVASYPLGAEQVRERHRAFLNGYYGVSKHFYDVTRKYYLFGRDRELTALAKENWSTLVEVGVGTGRNLKKLHALRPDARLGGVDASDEMLGWAQRTCPFARLAHGFAENADYSAPLGVRPERILFSYCLSMVPDPREAISHAVSELAPGGELVLVDFADLTLLPGAFARAAKAWLRTFHVHPVPPSELRALGFDLSFGPGRYYLRGRLRPPVEARR